MVYDPTLQRARRSRRAASRSPPRRRQHLRACLERQHVRSEGAAAAPDGGRGERRFQRPTSRRIPRAFDKRGAQWLADCHRSQYGYPFRVGLQLALENRHRAVTLASFACSGAEVARPVPRNDAREGSSEPGGEKVPPQLDQFTDLLCRGAQARTQSASYTLPIFKHGSTAISPQPVTMHWCPPRTASARSTSCCCRSAATTSASAGSRLCDDRERRDFAPIAAWSAARSASARRSRASISACSTSA